MPMIEPTETVVTFYMANGQEHTIEVPQTKAEFERKYNKLLLKRGYSISVRGMALEGPSVDLHMMKHQISSVQVESRTYHDMRTMQEGSG